MMGSYPREINVQNALDGILLKVGFVTWEMKVYP